MRTLSVLALALCTLSAALQAPAARAQSAAQKPAPRAPDRAAVEARLASVRTLVEKSSAAQVIEESGKPEAIARRNEARQTLRHAGVALDNGDALAASSLLEDAARQLVSAAKIARGERGRESSDQREVTQRMESARALLAAQRRISVEKPDAGAASIATRIEGLLADAQKLLDAHNYAEARPLVDQAYLLAKASVSAMRRGDTLVRSLHFASKEEEYHYEVDRNDTHRMLVTLLAKREGADGERIRVAVERAQSLRRDADAQAARGEYVEAIRLLEDSTRELVRAIRSAGVFIPG